MRCRAVGELPLHRARTPVTALAKAQMAAAVTCSKAMTERPSEPAQVKTGGGKQGQELERQTNPLFAQQGAGPGDPLIEAARGRPHCRTQLHPLQCLVEFGQ